jgi:hypothetical protein
VVANEGELRYFCYDLGLTSARGQLQFSLVHDRP